MKVLHDWDEISIRVDRSRRRGISLLLYCIANKFPFLKGYAFVMKNTLKIEKEKITYMETLIKLDLIAGITPIFGIRDEVRDRHRERIDELERIYNVDIRRHIHIGEPPDPNRKRLWEPPLAKDVGWSFEDDYIRARAPLGKNEIPLFHVDYPYNIRYYIDFIYEETKENTQK